MSNGIIDDVFMNVVAAHSASATIANTQTALRVLVATDILEAISDGDFTSTTDVTNEASQDVQYVMAILNQGSYQAHIDASNLVISW